ncbi:MULTISPECIES: NYN domain-containing protein [unclassified Lacticaseibacillus]|uniref:NYN domain-containing protein n=1 Tax=unclassified Lacticaseibacillus TaxID=2759744 RepID=UPI00194431C4|nr:MULTISPECIES: NYN domain-containing protein [unclassified Lacticaseibacillus]
MRRHLLLVDGYNVIGNWPELAKLKATGHFAAARDRLLDILAEYRAHENADMIVVFDAMYVPGIGENYSKWNLKVVFTQQDETADSYIERLANDLNGPLVQLSVVTSDQAEQWTVFSRGALRISSREFYQEIKRSEREFNHSTDPFIMREPKRNQIWSKDQLKKLDHARRKLTRREAEDKKNGHK